MKSRIEPVITLHGGKSQVRGRFAGDSRRRSVFRKLRTRKTRRRQI